MRTSSIAALLALAACHPARPDPAPIADAEAAAADAAQEQGRVLCAVDGASNFARACTLDRTQEEAGLVLTVRHPDGAFHRLLVAIDGRGVVAADGAEPASVRIVGDGLIEVAIADDRYRLPATVKGQET